MASETRGKLAGYAALIQEYDLAVVPNWHQSAVAPGNVRRTESAGGSVRELFPSSYWPGDSVGQHLEFALKYDGTNPEILGSLFQVVSQDDLLNYIRSRPTGKYARRIWYLYEMLTGTRLLLDDLDRGNYVDLLEREDYYTARSRSVRRQRVRDNLLGDARFCPIVRRTDTLKAFERSDLGKRCQQMLEAYPPELLRRALSYLYTKETQSSFEIEHITPSASRTERFVALLHMAEQEDFMNKEALVDLQNRIVDDRFRDSDYRHDQNYVGEAVAWQRRGQVHYVSPKPEDLPGLMEGLIENHRRMRDSSVPPAVHAATSAFGFVFLRPFTDGNGRIHRFLIHNVLALRGFTPEGIMFPVSAAMLKNRGEYDAALEAFSRPLMALVDYTLDDRGRMTVHNETALFYRYIDMTVQAEALFRFIEQTIETELVEELDFLRRYDRAKRGLQEIVDMPDRLIDLFIRCCLQNKGRLSKRKRESQFPELEDSEVQKMEKVVREVYRTGPDTEGDM